MAAWDKDLDQPGAAWEKDLDEVQKPVRKKKTLAQEAVDLVRPTVEAAGAVGGGVLGTAMGPAGTVLGAGLGYGIGKGALRLADEFLGTEQPQNVLQGLQRSAEDVAMGAIMERGGQIVAPYISKGIGWLGDLRNPSIKAAKLVRESAGQDMDAIRRALQAAPEGETAAQATANINSPTWQALAQRASARDPRFYGSGMTPNQMQGATNVFQDLSGGANQTQMRAAAEGSVNRLNRQLIPVLETELNAANIAGVMKPQLEGQANRFAGAATSKVEDVRRFTAAGERAAERAANTRVPNVEGRTLYYQDGSPVREQITAGNVLVPGRYTYAAELEKRAEQVSQQAADASLPFGEASRFAQAASDSLAAHGLKPLKVESIQGSIQSILKQPEFAGNKDIATVMKRVGNDIAEWSGAGGVIDAYALDSIRKNSVNGAIRELYPAADKNVQKELAASMLVKVKPLIVDAIESSGGTGYGKYLSDYASGRQLINQKKLASKATELFKTNPKSFVELVEGNDPQTVEKIFGPGNYQIVKEMSANAMAKLQGIADISSKTTKAAEQATLGQNPLRDLMERHDARKLKIPWGLSPKTMALNRALDLAEQRLGAKTMNILTEGMKSGKSADELLNLVPLKDRANILHMMQDPALWVPGASAASINALTPDTR